MITLCLPFLLWKLLIDSTKTLVTFDMNKKKLKEKTYLSPEKHLSVGWACLPRVAIEDRKYLTILKMLYNSITP